MERFKTKAFEGVEVEGGRCGCEEAAVRGEARVVVGVSVNLDMFSTYLAKNIRLFIPSTS